MKPITALLALVLLASACQHQRQATPKTELTASANTARAVFYCGVITKSGQPCKNHVKNAGDHCRLHQTAKGSN